MSSIFRAFGWAEGVTSSLLSDKCPGIWGKDEEKGGILPIPHSARVSR